MSAPTPPITRVLSKYTAQPDGCWQYTGFIGRGGYGETHDATRKGKVYVHRVMYEYAVGPIPDGMQIDHLCRNRACVRPDHLEAVSPAENTRRGIAARQRYDTKDCCKRGHPRTPENTFYMQKGYRACLPCKQIQQAAANSQTRQNLIAFTADRRPCVKCGRTLWPAPDNQWAARRGTKPDPLVCPDGGPHAVANGGLAVADELIAMLGCGL